MSPLEQFFVQKKILITAGATYENIDPVRFIGNYSSGKMGIALANAAHTLGAKVLLLKGHTDKSIQIDSDIEVIDALSAKAMSELCPLHFKDADICIMAAAIADFSPAEIASQKIKKSDDVLTLTLKKNPDIIAGLGKQKRPHQYLVGFALETENAIAHAQAKMQAKNCDMLVLNVLNEGNQVFGSDDNRIQIFTKNNPSPIFYQYPKTVLAKYILQEINNHCKI